jgi:hypothetical protein
MSTSVYTGLNPFNFILGHFLQIYLWDVSYVRSYCSFELIEKAPEVSVEWFSVTIIWTIPKRQSELYVIPVTKHRSGF